MIRMSELRELMMRDTHAHGCEFVETDETDPDGCVPSPSHRMGRADRDGPTESLNVWERNGESGDGQMASKVRAEACLARLG